MDRFWLKNYPPGVPADVDPSIYPSLVALIDESFAKYRGRSAYVCMGRALTFGEVDALSKALRRGCKAVGCGGQPSRRAGERCRWRAVRRLGRGGDGVRREEGSIAHQGRLGRLVSRATDRLQASQVHRVPR